MPLPALPGGGQDPRPQAVEGGAARALNEVIGIDVRAKLHAIAVGSRSPLCQRLAADSGGVYRHVR